MIYIMIKKIIIFLVIVNIILPVNANNINKKEENLYNFKDLSIIMPSYDKYSELWNPTFEIFFK